jgi:5'-3' exoribonuclease 2
MFNDSPIIDFYPKTFHVDLKGKTVEWLGEVILPFIDTKRLLKCANERYA